MLVFPHFLNTGSRNSDPPPPKHDTTMTQHFGRFITIYQKRIQVCYLTSQNFEDLRRCITSAAGAGFGHVIALILFPSCVIWEPHCCADKHLHAGVTCSQPQATSHSRSDATNGYSAAPGSVIFTSWGMASCSLVKAHRRFRGAYCLHHQVGEWWWRQYAPLKRRPTSTKLRGVISQKREKRKFHMFYAAGTHRPSVDTASLKDACSNRYRLSHSLPRLARSAVNMAATTLGMYLAAGNSEQNHRHNGSAIVPCSWNTLFLCCAYFEAASYTYAQLGNPFVHVLRISQTTWTLPCIL
jgi:hypothetical protein